MQATHLRELIAWQWKVYGNAHQDRRNLLIHIVAVPLFGAGAVGLVLGLSQFEWLLAGAGLVAMLLGFGLQGFGHRFERTAPPPFASRAEFVTRILTEQFVVFPRFVLSGAWLRRVRRA
jgi:uncharacterized membrane protein YGL010W